MFNTILERVIRWVRFLFSLTYPRDLAFLYKSYSRYRLHPAPKDIWRHVDGINGYLNNMEAGLLYWAARHCPVQGPVIELGSLEGRSTTVFAMAGRNVHAIDAWNPDVFEWGIDMEVTFHRFKANLLQTGIEHLVTYHRGLTQNIAQSWRTACAILFIDAGHTYAQTRMDIDSWIPFLNPHGYLILHDVLGHQFPGVTQAAGELLQEGWKILASSGSAVVFVRY